MRILLLRFAALIAAAGVCTTAQADFTNGNFETGNLAGWTITPTANGQSPTQTVVQWDIDFGGPLPTSFVGRFNVGQVTFQSGVPAGIELTQSLNLISGITYTIGFDWSAHRDTTTGGNAQGGIFDLIVNGTSIANAAAGSTSASTPKWGNITMTYTATFTGAHVIGARITRPFTVPGDLWQSVDNFTLTSPIPEPSTFGLWGSIAVLGALMRRRATAR